MTTTHRPSSTIAASEGAKKLSTAKVMYFIMGAIGSLLVVAGSMPVFFAVTGLTSAPAFFLAVAVVLAVFSVGYIAMARHIKNAGAFYAFVSKGLGRPLGVSAALMALLAYNLLNLSLYGLFAPTMADTASKYFGWNLPWWAWALIVWAIVGVLGLVTVEISAKVLAVLSILEVAIIGVVSVIGLAHPAPGGLSLAPLAPSNLFVAGAGAIFVLGVLGFIGFEMAPVFGEEVRNYRRTVPFATYFTLALVMVVYVVASMAMLVHYGADQVASAGAQGPEMFFSIAAGAIAASARGLFLTSMFAALLAYHAAVGRYTFALGREGVLPRMFGLTGRRMGAPWVASLAQSTLALATIFVFAWYGWDPVVQLFFNASVTGGFGVLCLLVITSVSIVVYFARDNRNEPLWHRAIAPGLAGLVLAWMTFAAVNNYAALLGVPEGSLVSRLLPASFGAALVVGLMWALFLFVQRRDVYDKIGLGPEAVTSAYGRLGA